MAEATRNNLHNSRNSRFLKDEERMTVQKEAILLDGTATARTIRAEVAEGVKALKASRGITPHLAAVLIGRNPASETYVAMKQKACGWVGMASSVHQLDEDATQEEAEALVTRLNDDPDVSGILVQHPLPKHLHEPAVLDRVSAEKDIDGISRMSLGGLMNGEPAFESCTPAGIIELLDRYNIPIQGKQAVVVGRSIILGKPVALMLLNRHATVTICHSRTPNLAEETRRADILVAAVGRADLIKGDMIKPGAAVLDAGYNRVEGRSGDVGDVEFESASKVAGWITPVPGGVGPMTIAMLLRNTLHAAEGRKG
jgi:methylenetetrahydrofolate dehydrogenase (NADP+) / methenyltetrahydrofolate cyclohydrolase